MGELVEDVVDLFSRSTSDIVFAKKRWDLAQYDGNCHGGDEPRQDRERNELE
jgi:hypothetical protein